MQQGRAHLSRASVLDNEPTQYQTWLHIRPLAVSPLKHPEGVPIPWGFLLSGHPGILYCGGLP